MTCPIVCRLCIQFLIYMPAKSWQAKYTGLLIWFLLYSSHIQITFRVMNPDERQLPRSNLTAWPFLRTILAVRLLLLLLALPVVARAQYNCLTNNGTITITQYTGSALAVEVPPTINGLPVTCIGDNAFYQCIGLTSVAIPDSVTVIGNYAFGWCSSLTNLSIPNSVTSIGDWAFSVCGRLTTFTIPSSVSSLEGNAFSGCSSLTEVTIGDGVTSIGSRAFAGCTSLAGIAIPNSVTNLGNEVFNYCTLLTNITIGKSVTNIEGGAFEYCASLTNVTIPNSVTSIGAWAFYRCTSLGSITIPDAVHSIGDWSFEGCTKLASVYFMGNAPPIVSGSTFLEAPNVIVYYRAGTTGWSSTLAGRLTALWNPVIRIGSANFGSGTNPFGFAVTGPSNMVIVLEACVDLSHPTWSPLHTNTLGKNSLYFSDPQWSNYPARYYRLRSL
jgi:hypothetical protein